MKEEVFRTIYNTVTINLILKFSNLNKLFEVETDILDYVHGG